MTVRELSKNQLDELKANYYSERHNDMSFGDFVNIDELVTDEEVFEEYANTTFVKDDFSCD